LEDAQAFCQRLRDVLDGRDVAREIVDALDAKATRMISNANMLRWEEGKKEAAGIREAVELIAEGWLGKGVTEVPGQEFQARGTEQA
jgi:hypothetical protein